jgi:hypothetical protein
LPTSIPVVGPLKIVFETVPQGVRLTEVEFAAVPPAATLEIRAEYRGEVAASILAAQWARDLTDSVCFSSATVAAVSGSGRDGPAVVEIKAAFEGG